MGMGREIYESSPQARALLDQSDDILSMPLTKLMFEGPDQELQRTENSQPAILAMSLACLTAWEEMASSDHSAPIATAGHSLGEYTSLVASGALEWADGLRLVRERGRLMQYASDLRPGGMAAIIGLDETIMEEICMETGVEIANINADDQIVISGDRLFVAKAMDLASARGAKKTVQLAVSGAFHSSLMYPAQEGLAEIIAGIKFNDPQVPIIANATSLSLTTADAVKGELMSQLCSCVHWKRSMKAMTNAGVDTFVEFGPGKVLGNLMKRIDRQASVYSLGDLSSIQMVAGMAT